IALKVAELSEVVVVPSPLVAYRRRPTGLSARVGRMWRSYALLVADARRRRPELPAVILRRSRAQFALYLAAVSFWSGNYLRATVWAARTMPSALAFKMLPHAVRLLVRRRRSVRPAGTIPIRAGVSFSR